MKARDVDQTALGKALGISSQAVSQWLSRAPGQKTGPLNKRLTAIAKALRVTVPALMADVGEPFEDTDTLNPTLLSPDESQLIASIRTMPAARAQAFFVLARAGDRETAKSTPSRTARKKSPPRPFVGREIEKNRFSAGCPKVVPIQRALTRREE